MIDYKTIGSTAKPCPERARQACALLVLLFVGFFWPQAAQVAQAAEPEIPRLVFTAGDAYLVLEFLDDDLLHVELASNQPAPDRARRIWTSPMVHKTAYPGPSQFSGDGFGFWETPDLRVQVGAADLCLTVTDRARDPELVLSTICPADLERAGDGLTLTPESFTHAYGLGQHFSSPTANGDWVGRVRSPGSEMGNAVVDWNGGAVGNIQFPVLYLAGAGRESYALFLDDPYAQRWDLRGDPWTVETSGDVLRFYLLSGPDLQDLRHDYMGLVGRPPVPPKTTFGLWVSEYGYDDWAELEDKLRSLRANGFPVDGFVLDLQWFGGVQHSSKNSPTGSLTWDPERFPDPETKVAQLRDEQGVGLLLIEHAYLARNVDARKEMEKRDYLVRRCETCSAITMRGSYWGRGSMIDWTDPAAGAYWHDLKREPLVELGVVGHWTDLGEPFSYDARAWYFGFPEAGLHRHADVHNLLNLAWSRSIYEGYARNGRDQRPFSLTRAGAPGSQRYGAALWSADIGANLGSLAGQLNAQMHMSMSGVDYYGADVGGFHRSALSGASEGAPAGDPDELYTIWMANAGAFDLPLRPHTENLCNCRETAPDRIGHLPSNLDNVRQRYALIPTYYSLAHRAYLYGEPLVPPLVYYYPEDPAVREMGDQKMIGRDLLVAAVTEYDQTERCVYLPAGEWVDVRTQQRFESTGAWFGPLPTTVGGSLRLPTFARAGALLPQMHVDERTMNALGRRADGSRRDELIVRAYAIDSTSDESTFTLYEDDGQTLAYQRGEVRTTPLSQARAGDRVTVTVGAATGDYAGAPARREVQVALVTPGVLEVERVSLSVGDAEGLALPRYRTRAALDAAPRGWTYLEPQVILAKSGAQDVALDKQFLFELDEPSHRFYLPSLWSGAAPDAGRPARPAGYADRFSCEWSGASLDHIYLPLLVGRP